MVHDSTFERDTAVTGGDGSRYRAEITDRWDVLDGPPNGGYLTAIAARAAAAGLPGTPDPVAVTAHFLAPPDHGRATVDVEVLRTGGRHSTAVAALCQDDVEILRLIGTFTDLSTAAGTTVMLADPPALPEPESLPDPAAEGAMPVTPPPIMRRFDHRLPPERLGWTVGRPTGEGVTGGWVRWADGAPMDPLGILVVADAYPPALFDTGATIGWVPTIELSVQLRRRPAAGWLRTHFTSRHTANGYLEEDGQVWDDDGLVALSRQLALAPR